MKPFLVISLLGILASAGAVSGSSSGEVPLPLERPEELTFPVGQSSYPRNFVQLGSAVLFAGRTEEEGFELWKTDGTAAGTEMVKSTLAGTGDGMHWESPLVAMGPRVYFLANDSSGRGLWSSDGTTAGTTKVIDVAVGTSNLVRAGSNLYFLAFNRREIWRSDGTAAGTVLFAQTNEVTGMRAAGTYLFYMTNTYPGAGAHGIWRTDGTVAGTVQVNPPGYDPYSSSLISTVGNLVLFNTGSAIWKSDGTVAGTQRLVPSAAAAYSVARADGSFFILATEGTGQRTIFHSQGTEATTVAVGSVTGSWVSQPVTIGNQLLALVVETRSAVSYMQLWSSDGTNPGTQMLAEWRTAASYPVSAYHPMIVSQATCFFTRWDTATGYELWKTDGSLTGLQIVKNIAPEPPGAQPWSGLPTSLFEFAPGTLLFAGSDSFHGDELWRTDGTSDGTFMVKNIEMEASIRGRVTDVATGTGLPNIAVVLSAKDSTGRIGYLREYLTDANGDYSAEGLPTGAFLLQTDRSGRYVRQTYNMRNCPSCDLTIGDSVWVVDETVTTGIDFALTEGGTISGTVTEAGVPVEGVVISVASVYGGPAFVTAKTDPSGAYVTPSGVPTGSWIVSTSTLGGYSSVLYNGVSCAAGCSPSTPATPVVVPAGGSVTGIDFAVKKFGKISGRVTDAVAGTAIRGYVYAFWTDRPIESNSAAWASTSADGAFELTLPDGRFTLVFSSVDGHTSEYWQDVPCEPCTQHLGTPVSAVPGVTTPGYDVALQPKGGRIRGVVTDAVAGTPLSGVEIRVYNSAGTGVAWTSSASDGSYATSTTLASGSYFVRANPYSSYTHVSELFDGIPCQTSCSVLSGTPLVISGTNTAVADFSLEQKGEIKGRITSLSTGQPLYGTVYLYDAAGNPTNTYLYTTDGYYSTGKSLAPGTYYARAEAYQYVSSYYGGLDYCQGCPNVGGTPIVVTSAGTTTADFALKTAFGTVAGRVTDAVTGAPIANAYVSLSTYGSTYTNSNGDYSFVNMTGSFNVFAESSLHIRQANNGVDCPPCTNVPLITPTSGQTTVVNFALRMASFITGRVVDLHTRRPLQGIGIQIWGSTGYLVTVGGYTSAVTDAQGFYRSPKLTPGTYKAGVLQQIASDQTGYLGQMFSNVSCYPCFDQATPINVGTSSTVTANFDLPSTGRIWGHVRNRKTRLPVGMVDVVVYSRTDGSIVGRSTTDSSGMFSLLVPGGTSYSLATASTFLPNQLYSNIPFPPSADPRSGTPILVNATSSYHELWLGSTRADFNGDGTADLVWRNGSSGANSMWLMAGSSLTGVSLPTVADPNFEVAASGDFQGDGKADLVWRNAASGANVMWLMDGGTVAVSVMLPSVGSDWLLVGSGDFQGDGKADLLWRNRDSGQVVQWLMDGASVAVTTILPAVGRDWAPVGIGDLQGDGKEDVIWRNAGTGANIAWLMNGTSIAAGVPIASEVPGWRVVGVADFQGDGKADLVWRHDTAGLNRLWLMDGPNLAVVIPWETMASGWDIVKIADFQGDGHFDVLWRHRSSGENVQWYMLGAHRSATGALPTVPAAWNVTGTP